MSKKRNTTPPAAPVVKSPEEQAAERLPLFGPGLVIRIPLNPLGVWLAYQKANHLEVLDPLVPAHERINQQLVYVKDRKSVV